MRNIIARWIILMIAVWVASAIIPGLYYDDWGSLMVAALVLGIMNSLVKPVLQVISIPFIIVTFGFFLLVINAIILRLTAWLVEGFHVSGFLSALCASLVISVVSMFLGYNRNGNTRRVEYCNREPPFIQGNEPPPGKGPIIDV